MSLKLLKIVIWILFIVSTFGFIFSSLTLVQMLLAIFTIPSIVPNYYGVISRFVLDLTYFAAYLLLLERKQWIFYPAIFLSIISSYMAITSSIVQPPLKITAISLTLLLIFLLVKNRKIYFK